MAADTDMANWIRTNLLLACVRLVLNPGDRLEAGTRKGKRLGLGRDRRVGSGRGVGPECGCLA